MAPRDSNGDEDWEHIESSSQVDDEFQIIQSDRLDKSENPDTTEPATSKDDATGSDVSRSRRHSSRSSSPRDASGDNMAVVRRDLSNSQLTLPHRPRQQQSPTSSPTSVSHRARSRSPYNPAQTPATPATHSTRPTADWRTWAPRQDQPQRPSNNSGHTYGAIYARGNATVLMGNVVGPNNENTRNHSYGPVFTTDQAKIYVGDVTGEEAARIFQRRRDEGSNR